MGGGGCWVVEEQECVESIQFRWREVGVGKLFVGCYFQCFSFFLISCLRVFLHTTINSLLRTWKESWGPSSRFFKFKGGSMCKNTSSLVDTPINVMDGFT